jgi:hypothetical protein
MTSKKSSRGNILFQGVLRFDERLKNKEKGLYGFVSATRCPTDGKSG